MREELVMYPAHAMKLSLRAEIRRNFVYNGQALIGFLPVQEKEDYSTVKGTDEQESSGNRSIVVVLNST